MEFGIRAGPPAQQRTGCLVLGMYEGGRPPLEIVTHGDLAGTLGSTLLLHSVAHVAAERVLLVGLGPEQEFGEASYRKALAAAMKALLTTRAAEATLCLPELALNARDADWKVEQAVLAVMEATYRFDGLKSKPPQAPPALKKVVFPAATQAAIDRGVAIAEGIALAKDLGNLPGNICTPAYLADRARDLGQRHGFKVTVLERDDIVQLGMGAFLAVARGSRQLPKLVVMEYRAGARNARPVVLVGKGITFDAGGISIKPAPEMDEMKFDMCGAASVFGALHAAALMKLPLDIVGIVPATENMPGDNAIKPGDVVTTMSGQTIEILDTDCEGRVVLCDALTYAERYEPAAVVDVATLTGAIVSALGHVATGVFANDDALLREIVDAGESAWDRCWPMPLWDDYQDALKSNFADLPNVGAHPADAITAACFLSRFAQRYPWAHLDVAGTASRSGADKGATGRPVALLAHFLARRV